MAGKYRTISISIGLTALSIVAFEEVRKCGFVSDDTLYVVRNQYVQGGLTCENIAWAFTHYIGYWHPVTWLSLMADCEIFGGDPGWHHLINLLLHTVNSILLFWLLKQMTGAVWRSAFVAALFAVHPLHVESVAWITERKDVLSGLFWMLTMAAYLRYVKRPAVARYVLTLLLFVLGLMTKAMLLTLPVILLLLDFWPLRRINSEETGSPAVGSSKILGSFSPGFRLFVEKVPFILLSLCSALISSICTQFLGITLSSELIPMRLRIANALVSYVGYIEKMAWPHNLAIFYPFPASIPAWQIAGAVGVLFSVSAVALYFIRRKPYIMVGWLWYIVTLVPVLGLVQAGMWPAMADRFTYLPLIGPFIVVTWGIGDVFRRGRYRPVILGVSAGAILVLLVICTRRQVAYWHDDVTLFGRAVRVTEKNHFALFNFGDALRLKGKHDEAIDRYREALECNSYHAKTHNNLGGLLEAKGQLEEAIVHYRRSVQIDARYPGTHFNLGKALAATGDFEEAIIHYEQAIDLSPDFAAALNALAWIHATNRNPQLRNAPQAIEYAKRTVQLTGDQNPTALDTLAAAYAAAGRFSDAVATAEEALKLAQSTGATQLRQSIEKRLSLYREGRPYIENSLP